ncbi:sulfotransferase 1A1-like isoform X2 [Babylonia areolata]|uniref:sulfotransferase 1A1-like isoform X2 n=1 Tax=Babylonia areolata TaxID=304850 RepID=UPI003FD517BC
MSQQPHGGTQDNGEENNDPVTAAKDDNDAAAANDPDGPIMPVVEVEGILLPKMFQTSRPLTEHVQLVRGLEMREDDVIILSNAKAGTHWVWEIASMLLSGKAEYEKRIKQSVMIEAQPIESIQSLPSPRVLNSHLPFRLLPRQILEKRVKVIHAYRNVKDVLVSTYFHYRQIPGAGNLTLESLEKAFFSEKVPFGNYFTFLKQVDKYVKNNPDLPFFNIAFEDLKEHPVKVIGALSEFLEVKASPQLCEDIAEATSFSNMKQAHTHKAQTYLRRIDIYRKGRGLEEPPDSGSE